MIVIEEGNSLLAQNLRGPNEPQDCSGTLMSAGFNLIQKDTRCTIVGDVDHNQTGNPTLGPLADNGGPTKTHALLDLENNPAVGKGSDRSDAA